jgi:hypothetical protein
MTRQLTLAERSIIAHLLDFCPSEKARVLSRLEHASAVDLPDGGMGSIRFVFHPVTHQIFGRELTRGITRDEDGVEVHISLILDQNDEPFELEFWKVDFSPLSRHPTPESIKPEQVIAP